jgi:hypothetical protein
MLESKSLKVMKKKQPVNDMKSILNGNKHALNTFKVRINEDDNDFGFDEMRDRYAIYGGTGEQSVFGQNEGCSEEQEEEVDNAFNNLDYSEDDVNIDDTDFEETDEFAMGGQGDEISEPEEYYNSNGYAAFDPRIAFFDSFVSANNMIVPFATDTAASAYYDMVFSIESKVADAVNGGDGGGTGGTDGVQASETGSMTPGGETPVTKTPAPSDKVAPNTGHVSELGRNADMFGV